MISHKAPTDKARTSTFLFSKSLFLLLPLAAIGCAPAYPLRQPADFSPVSATQPSRLSGSYRNHHGKGQDVMLERLWNGLTGRDDRPASSSILEQSSTSDTVRIEVVSSTELRVKRLAKGVEEETASVHGHFQDGYFYIDPRIYSQNIVIICYVACASDRIGVNKDANLILDVGEGGVGLVFGWFPVIGPTAAVPVVTRTFERVSVAATTQEAESQAPPLNPLPYRQPPAPLAGPKTSSTNSAIHP